MFGITRLIYKCLILSIVICKVSVLSGYAQDGNNAVSSFYTFDVSSLSSSSLSSADSAWASRPLRDWGNASKDAIMNLAEMEVFNKQVRTWALNFASSYPNDKRKYQAILTAVNIRVNYWIDPLQGAQLYAKYKGEKSIPVNDKELSEWINLYPKLRSDYLSSSDISEKNKLMFRKGELIRTLKSKLWKGSSLPIDSLILKFEDAIKATKQLDPTNIYSTIGGSNVLAVMELVFNRKYSLGWSDDDLQLFINKTVSSEVEEVRNWGEQHVSLMKLRSTPFVLKHIGVNGEVINLADYKGKVVLVDFWATWCGSCIEGMKKLKKVYLDLHKKGFDVISVSVNAQSEYNEVMRVKKEVGIEWPLMIIGGKDRSDNSGLDKKILTTYGFNSLPQLLLFDKNGNLVEYKGTLNSSLLGETVKKYL